MAEFDLDEYMRRAYLAVVEAEEEGYRQALIALGWTPPGSGVSSDLFEVKDGVCLTCGDGVLNSGEHIDPERHNAFIRAQALDDAADALTAAVTGSPSAKTYTQVWLRQEAANYRGDDS